MLDIQFIRDNPSLVAEKSKQKGYDVNVPDLLKLDDERLDLLKQVENLRQSRNQNAEAIKQAGKPEDALINQGKQIKVELAEREGLLRKADESWLKLIKSIPNMPLDDVPVGSSEDQNVVIKEWGDKPEFDFVPKSHWQLGEDLDMIDKMRAAKVSGARFAYIKRGLAELQFALIQLALNVATNEKTIQNLINENKLNLVAKPFIPILPPALIRTEAYEQTGRLNAEEITYKLADDDLWLNASAEHSLCNIYMDEVLSEKELPIRYLGYATSFRREAGTYGKDTDGIIRMHQFNKVEMEVFSTTETGRDEHLLLVAIQEYLMQQLGLPYRVLNKCTADIGGPNARGVDIDAWMAGEGRYLETNTADYMTDYQTRRLNTRYKTDDGNIEFAHTNDATAFAQRPMAAIMEHYQTQQGKVRIPEKLKPLMGGKEYL